MRRSLYDEPTDLSTQRRVQFNSIHLDRDKTSYGLVQTNSQIKNSSDIEASACTNIRAFWKWANSVKQEMITFFVIVQTNFSFFQIFLFAEHWTSFSYDYLEKNVVQFKYSSAYVFARMSCICIKIWRLFPMQCLNVVDFCFVLTFDFEKKTTTYIHRCMNCIATTSTQIVRCVCVCVSVIF